MFCDPYITIWFSVPQRAQSMILVGIITMFFFFERQTNHLNELLAKFIISGYTHLRTGENPHLGPNPVNTRPKARQCGEVKLVQFNDRTSDLHLFA
ncbi:hypothetical protein Hanom_Chr13g01194271 [Helianthus anomalus]